MENLSGSVFIPFYEGWSDFGVGTLLNAVVIDQDQAEFDAGALHGRSRVEGGITFLRDPVQVPNGRRIPVVWVAMDPSPPPRYVGMVASELLIDPQAQVGFKDLARQSNQMLAALRGRVEVASLSEAERQTLKKALMDYSRGLWERATPGFRTALGEGKGV